MKITETVERECCTYRDLKRVMSAPLVGRGPTIKFCVHCGARHVLTNTRDAAGAAETAYVKVNVVDVAVEKAEPAKTLAWGALASAVQSWDTHAETSAITPLEAGWRASYLNDVLSAARELLRVYGTTLDRV